MSLLRRVGAVLSAYALAVALTGVGWLALAPAAQAAGAATSLTLLVSPSTVQVGGTAITATVTATIAPGVPAPGETVVVSSSDPNIAAQTGTTDATGIYTATFNSSNTAGPVRFTANDPAAGGAGISSPPQTITQAPGPAAKIALTLQPPVVKADGASSSTATATVTDAFGNPVAGDTVKFSSSNPGDRVFPQPPAGNVYTASIISSTQPGPSTITADDLTAGISTQQTLTEVALTPANIVLSLQPSAITADGVSTSTATATVTDASGNPVAGRTISFSSIPSETISGTTDNRNGTYSATITSSTTAGTVKITARDVAAGLRSAAQTLTQAPGPPASISLTLVPSTITADGVSGSTATATVIDRFGNPVPGQNVSFSSTGLGERISGTTGNGNGIYSATIISSTTAGQASITARLGGITSAPQTLTQTPGRAANVALTLQPPVVAADGASLSTATATVTDAHGNAVTGDSVRISSSNPGDRIFAQPPAGNVYTASIISSNQPGNSTITATDSSVPPISTKQTLKEVAGTSSTTLVTSPASPASTNQGVALLATVSGSGGSPSGTVQFTSGGSPIPGCTGVPISPSSTLALCQTSFAATQSPAQIAAAFTPDLASTVAGSSATGTVTIGPSSTSTTLRASSPTPTIGANETYTAFVSSGYPGPVSPTGTVMFKVAGNPLRGCTSVPLQASFGAPTASCPVRYSTLGTRRVTATYNGDQNFGGSSSSTLRVPVQALGAISSVTEWVFGYTPRYTTVASLVVHGVTLGTKVTVTCHGRGCPFAKRTIALSGGIRCTPTGKHHCGTHAKGPINLGGAFHRHRLIVGTRITVEIRRPGWVGKFYSFLIRSGRQPRVRISCVAPGLTTPGVDC